jgi:hypothetical protein
MNENIQGKFGPHTLFIGILFIVMGMAGIIAPVVMSLGTVIFSAWLLFLGGAMWGIHTYRYNAKSLINWIKSALLLGFGVLMLIYPIPSIEALGLLLAIYLLLDAFNSFAMAKHFPLFSWPVCGYQPTFRWLDFVCHWLAVKKGLKGFSDSIYYRLFAAFCLGKLFNLYNRPTAFGQHARL